MGYMTVRRARPEDAEAIRAVVAAGFESYREFAGPDWRPPPEPLGGLEAVRERLASPDVWAAVYGPNSVHAVVAFRPLLSERQSGEPVPGVAHFWLLFVHPDWWRRGIGRELHQLAVREMHSRGYTRAELRTPAGAERARSFYEGSGWIERGSIQDDALDLELVIYELDLKQPE